MGGAKLLTAADERAIMTRVQGYLKLEKRFAALKAKAAQQGKPEATMRDLAASYSSKVTVAQMLEVFEEGEQCKTAMVESNYRLVVAVAGKYQDRGLPMKDLVSEGIGGLMRAIEKFDPKLGYKFSTYAHWWIRQAVLKAITEQARIVRLPAHLHDQAAHILRLRADMIERDNAAPSDEDLAAAAGITTKRLSQLMMVYRQPKSLDSPIGGDDGGTLEEMIEDEGQADSEQTAAMQSLRTDIESILHELPVREANVLRMRYGLDQYDATTLEDIGERFNVTRERIRQIEAKALRKLRMSVWRSGRHTLEDYDEEALRGKELAGRSSKASTKSA